MEKDTLTDIQEVRIYWQEKAKTYAQNTAALNPDKYMYQWQLDALYVAYLRGVQAALHIRIVD